MLAKNLLQHSDAEYQIILIMLKLLYLATYMEKLVHISYIDLAQPT